jgi:polysaccharide biosynthesis protein PslG
MHQVFTTVSMGLFALTLIGCSVIANINATPTETPLPTKVAVPVGNATLVKPGAPTAAPGQKVTPTEIPPPTATSPKIPSAKPIKMNSPEYGAQAFLWWRPETADRDLGLMKAAGLTWVKQQFAWRDIEGAGKGKFNWENADRAVQLANAKGIDVLARLDNAPDWAAPGCFNQAKKQMGPAKNSQDWLDFLSAIVTRYKGRVRAYEIWNEPNLSREWCGRPPNPTEYAALLKVSYEKIKSIDPNAIVVSAGLTPTSASNDTAMPDVKFVEQMYTAMKNNSNGYFDALGVHAPGYKAPPEMSPDEVIKNPAYSNNEPVTGRVYCFRHVEDIRKVMEARGDTGKQIMILEFGWTMDPIHKEYSWFAVDEQTQAKYVVDAFQWAKKNWSPWIGAMFVIYMANPDWTKDSEEYWWSITQPDGNPRGAYVRIKAMPK